METLLRIPIPAVVERVAATCGDCGLHVHRSLGPGFKEGIYEQAFCLELDLRGVKFECRKAKCQLQKVADTGSEG